MNYNKELATIKELYRQVYAPKNLDEDFEFLDEFSDEEIDDIVEEVVLELLDEGYEVDEIEDLFEDTFLVEGRVDMESRAARRKEANAASERSANLGKANAARIAKIAITTTSSIKVKPFALFIICIPQLIVCPIY